MSIVNNAYAWWTETGGVLVDAGPIFPAAVIFSASLEDAESLRPLLVGRSSLPASVLGSTDFNHLAASLRYQGDYARDVAAGYSHAIRHREPVEAIHHCCGLTTAGEIDMTIRKIALPVRTTKGGLLLLSFSERAVLH